MSWMGSWMGSWALAVAIEKSKPTHSDVATSRRNRPFADRAARSRRSTATAAGDEMEGARALTRERIKVGVLGQGPSPVPSWREDRPGLGRRQRRNVAAIVRQEESAGRERGIP